MSEVERLRALLAEAESYVDRDCSIQSIECMGATCEHRVLRKRIDAALAEPVGSEPPEPLDWACYDCGSTGDFSTVQHPAGDYDVKCDGCGSTRTDETGSVVRRLVLGLDTAQAERDEARTEVERLRTKAMLVIGDRYREGWMKGRQHGAEAMREAAAQYVEDADNDGLSFQGLADYGIRALPLPEEK